MASLRSIRVPPTAVPILKRLAELDDERSKALVTAVSTGAIRGKSALEAAVLAVLGEQWQGDEVQDLLGNLISISSLASSHQFSADAIAEALVKRAGDKFTENEAQVLTRRLAVLIDAPDLLAYSKAADIYTEFDRLLHVSRIITDIRPVFSREPNPEPLGAVIVHTLRLDYFDAGRTQTISFALSRGDLTALKNAIERAEEKETRLSTVLDSAGLVEFDIAEDHDV